MSNLKKMGEGKKSLMENEDVTMPLSLTQKSKSEGPKVEKGCDIKTAYDFPEDLANLEEI